MTRQQLKKILTDNFSTSKSGPRDIRTFSVKRDGTFIFRRSYFYTHGMHSGIFAQQIAERLSRLNISGFEFKLVQDQDFWKAWPSTSYFEAQFSATETTVSEDTGKIV